MWVIRCSQTAPPATRAYETPVVMNIYLWFLKNSISEGASHVFDISFDLAIDDIFMSALMGAWGWWMPIYCRGAMPEKTSIIGARYPWWGLCFWIRPASGASAFVNSDVCGEALPTKTSSEFYQYVVKPRGQVWNLYGPTETNVVTARLCEANTTKWQIEPLGTVLEGSEIAILTESGQIVDITEGATGELLLGGEQMFSGYLPAIDKNPFVERDGQRFYRSGDLVRVDDELIYIGRARLQIKIRGYRVEWAGLKRISSNLWNQQCRLWNHWRGCKNTVHG